MKKMTTNNNLMRKRAAYAYAEVVGWEKAPWKKKIVTRTAGLPIDIRTQGICMTLTTLLKGDLHETILADLMGQWVLQHSPRRPDEFLPAENQHQSSGKALLAACVNSDRQTYMAIQNEAYAISEQIKLFANAYHGKTTG